MVVFDLAVIFDGSSDAMSDAMFVIFNLSNAA
ncbi:hypothetical protein HNR62_002943 [Oceanisphaera litoralis]|nr:hypothetical protein [Oceanisphaera litoralis]